jgi:transcriptional regulator GlxA family with amidase domain
MPERRTIAFVLFDRALALNLNGPAEVFSLASHLLGEGVGYDIVLLSERGGPVRTSSGIVVETQSIDSVDLSSRSVPDTLIVVGGSGASAFTSDAALVDWIRRASTVARRTCSVCNGAFLLAAAGLLDGLRAVTHWCEVDTLRSMYPRIRVELDPIYLREGAMWTSAGMTAGIDLALALVEDDHGRRLSLAVARELVVFVRRAGGQPQFSAALDAQTRLGSAAPESRLADLPAWILDNLRADLTVDALARSVGMSPRTFARNFARWHGGTPARLVQDLRVEAARRHLDSGRTEIKRIADICGFGDEERMRRAFVRRFGVPPAEYRDRAARSLSPEHALGRASGSLG